MENLNNKNTRFWAGVFVMGLGIILLLDNLGVFFPDWVFGWYTFLILFGLYLGKKRDFQGSAWIIIVAIGIFFNLNEIPYFDFALSKVSFSVALLGLGLYLIVKPKTKNKSFNNFEKTEEVITDVTDETLYTDNTSTYEEIPLENEYVDRNDIIEINAIFGGSNQRVFSKNFKGGDIVAVFGGADVNFVQADFKNTVRIDVSAVFGGIKLIVPHNWAVKSNVTAIFGSVEDNRPQLLPDMVAEKTIVLDGVAMFGGVEIKSY